MTINKEDLLKAFISNFVIKDKRERCLLNLLNKKKRSKFTDLLNHRWDSVLDMRCFIPVDNEKDNIDSAKKWLHLEGDELCYIISDISELDDIILPFKSAYEAAQLADFGTLIINASANTCFLTTEKNTPTIKLLGVK